MLLFFVAFRLLGVVIVVGSTPKRKIFRFRLKNQKKTETRCLAKIWAQEKERHKTVMRVL